MRTSHDHSSPGALLAGIVPAPTALTEPPAVAPASLWARMRTWTAAHAVDDLYQGLVPASIPYFVLERNYGYTAASGLALAATLGGSLPQLLVGVLVDRRRVPWMAPVGVSLAGVGAGLAGLAPAYAATWLLLLLSGVGVSMFHPAAGAAARAVAGDDTTAMSLFAAGGSVGFFLAPLLATPALAAWGPNATVLFIPPALLLAVVLLRAGRRPVAARRPGTGAGAPTPDRPRPFLLLTAVEIVRSVLLFGVSTFIELFWLRHLGASHALAGLALTLFLMGGVGGTLVGGRLADRFGAVRTVQAGAVLTVPALVALRLAGGPVTGLPAAVAAGMAISIPFAVLVKLGQDYLPSRPGTASGVTLGLAVSAGGLAAPALGAIADTHGISAPFTVLCFVPALAVAMCVFLPEPARRGAAFRD
ncbi:MFS transporter [Frankia sp. R43]|uniref:MFS transporter n=2 Tax=unclassified Frankia TaxID=2632575 RepID=UPI0009FA9D5F|nr:MULTISPECIES: MFS transporter [unclassified Frankia]